jgi:hypothetical protein
MRFMQIFKVDVSSNVVETSTGVLLVDALKIEMLKVDYILVA